MSNERNTKSATNKFVLFLLIIVFTFPNPWFVDYATAVSTPSGIFGPSYYLNRMNWCDMLFNSLGFYLSFSLLIYFHNLVVSLSWVWMYSKIFFDWKDVRSFSISVILVFWVSIFKKMLSVVDKFEYFYIILHWFLAVILIIKCSENMLNVGSFVFSIIYFTDFN